MATVAGNEPSGQDRTGDEGTGEFDLELAFLRQSVERANVEKVRCADCRRVPLLGEFIFEHRDGTICELCHTLRHEHARSREQVRYAGAALTVRRIRRATFT